MKGSSPSTLETSILTACALVAFASNSLLTRLALGPHLIDAATFTLVRLGSGAFVLTAIALHRSGPWTLSGGTIVGPLVLFAYAAPFSFAYLRIGAAAGALILFGVVQITMIGWGIASGERPTPRTWVGLMIALAGLAILTLPSVGRPDLVGTGLMSVAGISWGVYSLIGRKVADPIVANGRNFLLSTPMAVLLTLASPSTVATTGGLAAAVAAGAITSGLGYVIWYRALRGLRATQAAIVQLSVPAIAALGAVPLLGESLTTRILVSGVAVLSGIALVLTGRKGSREV
jgi:drug/metabolite transporter (DMT)-like permease